MDKKKIIETLFDKKIIKILRLFINNSDKTYYLREISRITKVPPASTHRILQQLKDLELVQETKDRYLKTYSSIKQNIDLFSGLLEDKKSALKEFSDFIANVKGVNTVILHGEEEKDKASLLIVGEELDQTIIRDKTNEIKEKYKFNIIYLILAPTQYEQLSSMGLYRGRKVILYNS
ncbi:helix-turn-helix domain-containing protein [Candidatus Woesearchaeota archaeon]|nr:helix-turn-helix domain-containing protein [Candidatus Woesearchaeota archaeon]